LVNEEDKCNHIYADFSMCNKKSGYASSTQCKDHFRDIDCGTKESKIQDKRLDILRKVNFRMAKYGIGILPMGISGRVQIE